MQSVLLPEKESHYRARVLLRGVKTVGTKPMSGPPAADSSEPNLGA